MAGCPTCQGQQPIASSITFWVCPSFHFLTSPTTEATLELLH
jgi:hypothetical protein